MEALELGVKSELTESGELHRRYREAGLMKNQLFYYARTCSWILVSVLISVAFLRIIENPWIQVFGNGAFWAFLSTHVGFMGHDSGHQQIFLSRKKNLIVTWAVIILSGMLGEWWLDKHVITHHRNPNGVGDKEDGDIITPFAFTSTQALNKKGLLERAIVKHQPWTFYLILTAVGFSFKFAGIVFLMKGKDGKRSRYPKIEWTLLGIHFLLYFGLIFWLLNPWWLGFPFILVHQILLGIYMGSVFAPNHKGRPIIEREGKVLPRDWFRQQIITARDVNPESGLTSFWYGGLNNQVGHHWAPSMPRNNLGKASEITKQFCKEYGIPYHVTGVRQSVKEIHGSFKKVAKTLSEKAISSVT